MARPKNPSTQPVVGLPAKPAHLSAQASIEWDRLLLEIQAAGLQITTAHRAPLTLAATIAADIKSDWAELEREGQYLNSIKGGIQAHPALKRMDALRRDYIKVLAVIGLRPGTSTDPQSETTLDEMLND